MDLTTVDFYENSQRNIAVLLIFWLSYIIAYIMLAWIIIPSKPLNPLSRKRRSNLSRLMLLGRPERRPRSLPPSTLRERLPSLRGGPTECSGEESPIFPRTDISEGETLSMSDEIRSSSVGGIEGSLDRYDWYSCWVELFRLLLGKHILSTFAPEYTVTVLGWSLVLQGIILMPLSLPALAWIDGMPEYKWYWLSIGMLQLWWSWLWSASLLLMFIGLPMAIVWNEVRGHRHTTILKRLSLFSNRILILLSNWRLLKPLMVLSGLISLYLIAIIFGLFAPIRWADWYLFISTFCVTFNTLLSIICIPLGFTVMFKRISDLFSQPIDKVELIDQLCKVNEHITEIEASLEPTSLKRTLSMPAELTPISSKSLRSKLAELQSRSAELQSQRNRIGWESKWKRVQLLFLHTILMLSYIYLIYVQCRTFLQFVASNLLWYIPGVQFFDRFMYRLASLFSLVHLPAKPDQTPILSSSLLISSWMWLYLMTASYIGLYKLVRSRRRRMVESVFFSIPRWTLDQFLVILMLCLNSSVLSLPSLLVTGSLDYFDWQLRNGIKLNWYVSPLATILPPSVKNLIDSLCSTTFLRFPLLLWLIAAYRSTLLLTLILVGLSSLRDTFSRVVKRRPVNLHID